MLLLRRYIFADGRRLLRSGAVVLHCTKPYTRLRCLQTSPGDGASDRHMRINLWWVAQYVEGRCLASVDLLQFETRWTTSVPICPFAG